MTILCIHAKQRVGFEMTGHSRDYHHPMSFLGSIEQQDHEAFLAVWQKLTIAKEKFVSLELRLKKPWVKEGVAEDISDTRWILFLAVPQADPENNLTKVFGCMTDISGFKFAEHVQLVSRLQAEEAKRQQESFIDMTS